MLFWLLFSGKSIQNILILSAIVAPFASAGIRPVVNRLNQDTTVYYGLVFRLFFWPYMVKWHNGGIIKPVIAPAGISPRRRNPKKAAYTSNSRVYKGKCWQLKYAVSKFVIAWTGAAWDRWVMMTFLFYTPTSKRWLGWRKTENARRDPSDWFCDIYCTVKLRYSCVTCV